MHDMRKVEKPITKNVVLQGMSRHPRRRGRTYIRLRNRARRIHQIPLPL